MRKFVIYHGHLIRSGQGNEIKAKCVQHVERETRNKVSARKAVTQKTMGE
jgi:hypothetical protein